VFNGHQKSMKNRFSSILLHHFAGFGPSSWLCKTSRIGYLPVSVVLPKRSLWVRVAAGLSIGLCPTIVYAAPLSTTTTLAITASGIAVSSVAPGIAIKLTATVVSSATAVHPGTVRFCNASSKFCTGSALLGSAQLTATGTASIALRLPIGAHSVSAVFAGTASAAGSSSTAVPLIVTGADSTTTALKFSGVQGNYSLSGTVTGIGGGSPITGSLTFPDTTNGNVSLGSASLVPASAASTITLGPSYAAGSGPQIVVTGDFNGDGIPDLALGDANYGADTVSILLGNGDGTFTLKQTVTVGNGVYYMVAGDFNNDGIVDLIAANDFDNTYTVLLGKGDGTFAPQAAVTVPGDAVMAMGDFNGDGNLDFVVGSYGTSNITVLLGNGDGTFTAQSTVIPTGDEIFLVTAADFNGDGFTDLAIVGSDLNTATVLLSNGDGTFTAKGSYPTGNQPGSLITNDFNGDGIPDLIAANGPVGTLTVLLGKGDGTFTTVMPAPSLPVGLFISVSADFNGDGIPDLAMAGQEGSLNLQILLGNGDGTFTTQPAVIKATTGTYGPFALVAADFNGDGAMDIATADGVKNATFILLNQIVSTSTATLSGVAIAGGGQHSVEASYPGAGVYAASTSPAVTLDVPLMTTTLSLTPFPDTGPYGRQVVFMATLSPSSAGSMSTNGEQITFMDNGVTVGTGVLASGVATFTTSTLPIGSQTFTAVYPGDNSFAASTSAGASYVVTPPRQISSISLAATVNGAAVSQVAAGTSVTYTATVTANGAPIHPGQVSFCNARATLCSGSGLLGTASLLANGTASLKLRFGIGGDPVRAVFIGTSGYAGATSTVVSVGVTGIQPSTATLTSSGTAGAYILNATITGTGLVLTNPSGTVSFLDTTNSNAVVGAATLTQGTLVRSFNTIASPSTSPGPHSVVVADFNRDGIPDVATINSGDNTVSILLGNGDGTMTAEAPISTGGIGPVQILSADFNGDDIPDLVIANASGTNTVLLLLGNGDGTFTAKPGPAVSSPVSLAVADLNGDGILDLAVGTAANTIAVELGKGDGTFAAVATASSTGNLPKALAVGDFNGDGFPDLAVANYNDSTIILLLGNGDGTFLTQAGTLMTGTNPAAVIAQDVNGDGILDLVTANQGSGTLSVYLGASNGTFTLKSSPACGGSPTGVTAADFNGDGFVDLAAAGTNSTSGVTIFSGKGDGTFTAQTTALTAGSSPNSVATGDFNGDGIPDLVTANGASNNASVILGEITGTSTASIGTLTTGAFGPNPGQVILAYTGGLAIPGSGVHNVDVAYPGDSTYGPSTSAAIPLNGTPVVTLFKLYPSTTFNSFGQTLNLTAALSPFAVDNQSTNGETVTFTANGTVIGTGTLSGGIATFTSNSFAVGQYTMTASYPGDAYFVAATATAPYKVTPAISPTTTVLSLTANGAPATIVVPGTVVTLMATVMGAGQPVHPGTINFCNATILPCTGSALLGTAQLNSSGVVTIKRRFGSGGYQITARFAGNTGFSSSSSASVALSAPSVSKTAISSSGLPGNYVLTGTVSSTGTPIAPTGTVSFLDTTNANSSFASATVTAGAIAQSFVAAPNATVQAPAGFAVGDFNGDGKPDVIYTAPSGYIGSTNYIGVMLSNGDGTFTSSIISTTVVTGGQLVVGDFNNDGFLDVATEGYGYLTILFGHGDGTFTINATQMLPAGTNFQPGIGVADFNGDGNLDIVVDAGANGGSLQAIVFLGNGDGTFTIAPNASAVAEFDAPPAIGDFNRDGIPDMAFAEATQIRTLLGNGDGTFTTVTSPIPTQPDGYLPPVAADLNNDGILDLAVPNFTGNTVAILLGNGDGTFTAAASPTVGNGPQSIVAADFNSDGVLDLATGNYTDGTISVLLGKGDGTFQPQTVLSTVGRPAALTAVDLNGDGLPDLVASGRYASVASVYLNTASYIATATASNVSVPGTGIHYVDANYLGNTAYAGSTSSTIPLVAETTVAPPTVTATTISLSANLVTSGFGQSVTLTAVVSPHAGTGTTTNGETVNFLNNNLIIGSGTLSGGVATFTTTALPQGKNSLSAAYNGDSNFFASVSTPFTLTVTPATVAISLAISAAGQPISTVASNTTVNLIATVTRSSVAMFPGIVNFCDVAYASCAGPGLLGTVSLTKNGTASLKLRPSIGQHQFNAVFQAQTNYSYGTSTTVPLTVTGIFPSTTALAATGSQDNYTLTATTTGSGKPIGPTGGVSFYDTSSNNLLLGSGSLGASTQVRSFVPGTPTIVGNSPTEEISADFNGDGIPDIAVLDANGVGAPFLTILLGNGDGTFTAKPVTGFDSNALSFNSTARKLAVGDFNGDGIPDLAVGEYPGSAAILLGVGDGTFTLATTLIDPGGLEDNAPALSIGDFNGDGVPDLLMIGEGIISHDPNNAVIFPGNGDGTFGAAITPSITPGFGAQSVVSGDFNGDGILDIAVSATSGGVTVFLGTGGGSFGTAASYPGGAGTTDIRIGDFNGDGILDLATANNTANNVSVFLGNGDGTFAALPVSPTTGPGAYRLAIGDFNGDGVEDIAVANQVGVIPHNNSVTVLLGNGDGSFTPQGANIAIGYGLTGILSGDFNGDGQLDLALVDGGSDSVTVLSNQVTETAIGYMYNAQITGAGAHLVDAVYAGDSNFAGSTSPAITLNGITATATALGLTSTASIGTYGGSITLTATLTPAGAPATNGETVSFRSGTTVIGTAALNSGVAVLVTTALPAGSDNVTAVYSGDAVYGSSTSNAVAIAIAKANSATAYTPAASQIYGITAATAGILNATGTPVGGTFAYTATSGGNTIPVTGSTLLPAGTYSLTATYTPADATDYATSTQTFAGYVVNKATPVVSWATPSAILYGTQLTVSQLNAASSVAGSFIYLPAAGAILPVGSQTLGVTFTPTDSADYTTALSSVTLKINQATPIITWATPAPIAFGSALTGVQLDATASVPGTFVYNPGAGTSLAAGQNTLKVTFTPTDTVDYTVATGSVTLLVGQGTPTITWPAPAAISYGIALSGAQLNATANVPGTFVYTPSAGTVLHAGQQTLGVVFTPNDTTTYSPATASVTLQVNQATPVITWATPAAVSYGTALSSAQLDATANVTGSFTYTPPAGATPGVGAQVLKVVFAPTDTTDYTSVTDTVSLQVNQAVPAINWAAPPAVPYGTVLSSTQLNATANTPGTFTYTPAAGSTLTSVGTQTLKVAFTPTDTVDYTTATDSVLLAVNQATPALTWPAPAGIVYGTSLSAAQLDATANVPGSLVYTPGVGAAPAAGTQTLKAVFTPTDATDYAAVTSTINLAVTPAPLTITPANATRTYEAANPAFTYSSSGFVNGDSAAVLSGAPALTTTATTASAPGTYPITAAQGTLTAANYSFVLASGTLTVTQAASVSTVSLSAASISLGSPETVTVSVSSAATGTPTGTVTFLDGTTTLATVALTNGQASYTTSSFTAGVQTLNISYSGDADFAASTASASVTVSAVPADFTLASGGNGTQTILPGQVADYSFALAPTQGAYPGAVTFTVAGLPAGASATFSPASLTASSGPQTVVLNVQSTVLTARQDALPLRLPALALGMLLLPLAGARRLRRSATRMKGYGLALLLALAGFALAASLTGCGATTGFFGQSPKSYPLVVTATSGNMQHNATVTLTIE
jgi:hypothetical protein